MLGGACFRCLDALYKNRDQLVAFGNDILQARWVAQFFALDDAQPDQRFTQLFKCHFHLVDEILSRLRALSFPVIRRWRRSRTHKLTTDMVPKLGNGQVLNHLGNSNCEVDESIFEISSLVHASNLRPKCHPACRKLGYTFSHQPSSLQHSTVAIRQSSINPLATNRLLLLQLTPKTAIA